MKQFKFILSILCLFISFNLIAGTNEELLSDACRSGNVDELNLLLALDKDLVRARVPNDAKEIQHLEKKGLQPSQFTLPAHLAAKHNQVGALQILWTLDNAVINLQDEKNSNLTPLIIAAAAGHEKTVQWLLAQNARTDSQCQSKNGRAYTAKKIAELHRHFSIAALIEQHEISHCNDYTASQ